MSDLLTAYPLAAHNTFGLASHARYARRIDSRAVLKAAWRDHCDGHTAGLPRLILGGGSNIVLTRDFSGVVWLMALTGRRLAGETEDAWLVEAGAGESWHQLVAWTLAQGLPGLENLALIPGTVGAAPVQNIGAYGVEIKDRLHLVRAFDLARGEHVALSANGCGFGYRESLFKRKGEHRYVITSVVVRLPKRWRAIDQYGDVRRELNARGIATPNARQIFDVVMAIRQTKLPDPSRVGNAGSFFKNPVIGAANFDALQAREPGIVGYSQPDGRIKLAAGWLIDRCGWKGRALGRAGVHERQALVLVNRGGATGEEVLALARAIQNDVTERFGVALAPEPVII